MYPLRINRNRFRSPGLTLVELLVSTAVMGIICLGFGSLALSVQMANQHTIEKNQIGQHARVILQRVERALSTAHATEAFPGVHVIEYHSGGYTFPQAVAIWSPRGTPQGDYPQVGELVLFASDPQSPNRLLEIRSDTDTRPAPARDSNSSWQTLVTELIASSRTEVVEVSNLVRAGSAGGSTATYNSTLSFQVRVLPTDEQLAAARADSIAWNQLRWANSIHGSQTGLRQVWCAFQFQLVASKDIQQHAAMGPQAVPFFGSSAIYYQVSR